MARMSINADDDYAVKISQLAAKSEEIVQKAIYAGADILADEIKANLQEALSAEATGEMLAAFGIAPIDKDKNGNWNTHVGFEGYDERGVPNQLKARVFESGSSKQRKRPFVRPAVVSTKAAVIKKMNEIIDEEIKNL